MKIDISDLLYVIDKAVQNCEHLLCTIVLLTNKKCYKPLLTYDVIISIGYN